MLAKGEECWVDQMPNSAVSGFLLRVAAVTFVDLTGRGGEAFVAIARDITEKALRL